MAGRRRSPDDLGGWQVDVLDLAKGVPYGFMLPDGAEARSPRPLSHRFGELAGLANARPVVCWETLRDPANMSRGDT